MGEGHRKGKEENKMLTYNTKNVSRPAPSRDYGKGRSVDLKQQQIGALQALLATQQQQIASLTDILSQLKNR